MLVISDTARDELQKVMASEQAKDAHLVIFFQGQACSGPVLGMALEAKVENMDKIEANGIEAYIDPRLNEYLSNLGGVNIDFVSRDGGESGYMIRTGKQVDGSACGGCSCG